MRICNDVSRTCLDVFKKADDSDVTPNQHSIEHIICLLEIGLLHKAGTAGLPAHPAARVSSCQKCEGREARKNARRRWHWIVGKICVNQSQSHM